MKLQYHIFLRLIIPLILAMIICIVATVLPFYITVPSWINRTKSFMRESIIKTAELRTTSLGNYIDTFFKQVKMDINQIHNYTSLIFKNQIPTKNNYRSYYSTYSVDQIEPTMDSNNIYFASTNFKLGINSYSDFLNLQYINETSLIDNMFRAIYKSSNSYVKIYIGMSNGLFRRFPYARLEDYSSLSYTCLSTGQTVVGYDPRCRIWYYQSQNTEDIKFTPPYLDAFSKKMHLSISKGLMVPNFIGVIAADFSMDLLDQIVLNTKIVNNGYSLLMDNTGLVISYPNLDRTIINPMIWDIDKKFSISQWKMIIDDKNPKVQTKIITTDTTYYITYYNIPDANYQLVMIYKENDLYSDFNNLLNNIVIILVVGTVVLFIIILIIIVIIIVLNILITRRYTAPFIELTNMLNQMTKSNLDITIGNKPAISSELKLVHENFENLLIAVKFGNEAYYSGDLNKALQNYELAEKLMIKMNNNRGLGVCYNNKANVYKQLNNLQEAIKYYQKSIDNIKEILSKSINKSNLLVDNIILANRLMNIAVVYVECNLYEEAEKIFNESISLNRQSDNSLGIAKVSGNLGQLYIKKNKLSEAERILYEAYNIIKEKNDLRSLQYMTLNLGILEYHKKNFEQALSWLNYTLNHFDKLEIYVQKSCLQYLAKTYENMENHDMVIKINSLLCESKNIYFVLDCSGSMDGNPLEQCKKSIIDIIDNYLDNFDNLSLITFNTNYNVVIPLTKKYTNSNITNTIKQIKAGGNTAFYSALDLAINNLNKDKGDNKDWIIALTDGEDNSSKVNANQLLNKIKNFNSNIVIITIGDLKNENIIKNLCSINGKGHHIKIGVNNISLAFKKVAHLIIGQVNVEVL